jgi:hypothetical protein
MVTAVIELFAAIAADHDTAQQTQFIDEVERAPRAEVSERDIGDVGEDLALDVLRRWIQFVVGLSQCWESGDEPIGATGLTFRDGRYGRAQRGLPEKRA